MHSLGGGGLLSLFCLFLHPVMVNVHHLYYFTDTGIITSKMLEG